MGNCRISYLRSVSSTSIKYKKYEYTQYHKHLWINSELAASSSFFRQFLFFYVPNSCYFIFAYGLFRVRNIRHFFSSSCASFYIDTPNVFQCTIFFHHFTDFNLGSDCITGSLRLFPRNIDFHSTFH